MIYSNNYLLIIVGSVPAFGLEALSAPFVYRLSSADLRAPADPDGVAISDGSRQTVIEQLLDLSLLDKKVDGVTIAATSITNSELLFLLDVVEPRLALDASLELIGPAISAAVWERITTRFGWVELTQCKLGRGWWKPPSRPRECTWLRLDRCFGAVPKKHSLGGSAWPELQSLVIWGGQDTESLGPRKPLPGQTKECPPGWPALAEAIGRCLASDTLSFLLVTDLLEIDWLIDVLPRPKLTDLDLGGCPCSPRLLQRIAESAELKSLEFAWEPGEHPDWTQLRKMNKLRSLTVNSTFFDDRDLPLVLANTRLRHLEVYYTKLTAKSWSTLLGNRYLRKVWGSMELLDGPIPDLPETTLLKEFVALNARAESFRTLLARYPDLKVFQM